MTPSLHKGFFPQQVPIDSYGNGGFRFAEMSHQGNLLCLPDKMLAWNIKDITELSQENDIQPIIDISDQIDVLFVGCGTGFERPPKETLKKLQDNMMVECLDTGAAIRTYNVLLGENRRVAAALIAVNETR